MSSRRDHHAHRVYLHPSDQTRHLHLPGAVLQPRAAGPTGPLVRCHYLNANIELLVAAFPALLLLLLPQCSSSLPPTPPPPRARRAPAPPGGSCNYTSLTSDHGSTSSGVGSRRHAPFLEGNRKESIACSGNNQQEYDPQPRHEDEDGGWRDLLRLGVKCPLIGLTDLTSMPNDRAGWFPKTLGRE
ncbi:unnamed protein product [Merluccius merluccius]